MRGRVRRGDGGAILIVRCSKGGSLSKRLVVGKEFGFSIAIRVDGVV
jgi:hypothetical protein